MSHNVLQLRRRRSSFDPTDSPLLRLDRVMRDKREITRDDIEAIAKATHQPEAIIHGVATFYGDLGRAPRGRTRVKICRGTACFASAGEAHVRWMENALGVGLGETSNDGSVSLESVYCLGACNAGPSVAIEGRVYGELTEERAQALALNLAGSPSLPLADDVLAPRFVVHGGPAIVLERLSIGVDATKLDVARLHGVFEGLRVAIDAKQPDNVIAEVDRSHLRGRGGAGFPTAAKWRLAAAHAKRSPEAFVVCNGDEGDPGAYIDKWLMERDPFAVIEGIALAGYAIGATRGFLYLRSEYPRAAPSMRRAINLARAAGLLGNRILGSAFSFDIDVVQGAGSYVCGEETALLRSIEGLRGMVSARPPYPAEKGLFGRPTVINNVETLANLGWILRHGGDTYARYGLSRSRGTKVLSLNDRFVRPGLYEVPFGTPLRHVLEDLGGSMKSKRPIKAVQIGGPLGGILPNSYLDTPIGFEEFDEVGALIGHGGVVAWDDTLDLRDLAVHLAEFGSAESCGKCFPCRIGGQRLLEMVRTLKTAPRFEAERSVGLLAKLCETMKLGSLCAHGAGIPVPIASLFNHFRADMTRGEP